MVWGEDTFFPYAVFCLKWKMEIHLGFAGYKEIKLKQFKAFIRILEWIITNLKDQLIK